MEIGRAEQGFRKLAFYKQDDGEDSSVFTIKLHIGGILVWKPKVDYRDGFVEYFDYFNCDEGSLLDLRRMVKQLRFCDKKVQFWVKVKGKPKSRKTDLRKVTNDADILVLNLEVPRNKELDIYVEHLYDDQWDYEVEISRSLGDDALLTDEGSEQESEREVDGPDTVFEEVEVEVNGPTAKRVGNEAEVDLNEVDCVHSEGIFRSLDDSDDERDFNGTATVFQERNLKKEGFKFVLGMIFQSAKEFKWAVTYHEAMRRKDVKFVKNEGRRVRACCRHNDICKWTIFGSRSNPRCPFQIKTYNHEHTCGDQDDNKTVNSGFLARLYKEDFRLNMDWGRRQFQEHVQQKLHCQVTKHQAYRAKHKARKELEGQDSEQFNMLNDYCQELRRSNPGSTVKMKLDTEFSVNGRPRFLRLYICFGACKEGFLSGCRPFFGLDGCHLKGCQKGGQLLTAVGVDGDNCMFPIAFAVVEGELKESWKWFLQLLDSDLNISSNPLAWTIISDKQKGLVPAVEELFAGVEHRFCVRHMHANFVKDGFTGNVLKQKLWAVCKATTEPEFKRIMEELKEENAKAYEWLAARDPKHYCRAFFSTFPKSYMLLNNLCESWNDTILSLRDKPLLTMCDKIRLYLMGRMQKNRDKMKTYPHKLCPKISKLLEEAKDRSARYSTYKSHDNLYQVDDHNFKAFKVDLALKQCSCRGWDLTGIPCSHAVAAIRKQRGSPEDYVHQCYTLDTYLKAYEPAILPIQSANLWEKVDLPAPIPPKYKAQPGRPKKKRKIDPLQEKGQQSSQVRTKKLGEVKRCRVCGLTRHNKTTCKAKNPQVSEQGRMENQNVESEAKAEVEGQNEVEVEGQFEDIAVETQVPAFVLDEMGSQEVLGSQSSQPLHNHIPQESSYISTERTTLTPTTAEEMHRLGLSSRTISVIQTLARPGNLVLLKRKK
ncbi:uncharacterized protein LOC116029881 [Ipomoea triloba]|uniref:uncharacterized protein LOC116029881 n=1 Tax=Ipomoea triloba TaxID=35885 RepID=UPI00125E1337|nr:uncharacterized protein LOC116029881 [Ipomoea triloba]